MCKLWYGKTFLHFLLYKNGVSSTLNFPLRVSEHYKRLYAGTDLPDVYLMLTVTKGWLSQWYLGARALL
jgi:hypothetical protein